MRILIDHEKMSGLYLVETIGHNAHKRLLDAFLSGMLLDLNLSKVPEYTEKEIFEARSSNDVNIFHTVVHEELKIDGIAKIYQDDQHLMLYGSKYGHVYHYPIVRYDV